MKRVWCVKHREGWCATAHNSKAAEEATQVQTVCAHYVTLPLGTAWRAPTCATCLAELNKPEGLAAAKTAYPKLKAVRVEQMARVNNTVLIIGEGQQTVIVVDDKDAAKLLSLLSGCQGNKRLVQLLATSKKRRGAL